MSNSDTEVNSCAQPKDGAQQFSACACCVALAQVRRPGFDDAHMSNSGNGAVLHKTAGKAIAFGLLPFNFKRARAKSNSQESKTNSQESSPGADKAPESDNKDSLADDWHEDSSAPKTRKLWQGLDGKAVMLLGVVTPFLMLAGTCLSTPKRITLLLLNHPVETLAELGLVLAIPLSIWFMWSSLCKNNFSYTLGRGLTLGSAIGSSLIVAAVSLAALFWGTADLQETIGTDFTGGFCWIAFLAAGTAAVGVYLVNRIRLARDFTASRIQVLAFTILGMLCSVGIFAASEARPWSIRLAERQAVSVEPLERIAGLKALRAMSPERELRMECSDDRAAGLSGLFIAIKPTSQRELYFAVTGKPYSLLEFDNKDISFMPDDDLRRRIVGERVKGLSLIRSTMDGAVHPQTLSSTINWTFVFKNSTTSPQEVRTELSLPPGAVIDGLSLWRQGERQDATVAAAGKAEGFTDANWTQVGHDGPAIISDLGHGRMLMHCYPVSQDEELKVAVSMVVPLKLDGSRSASLMLPSFIASNFETKGGDHLLKLRSSGALSSSIPGLGKGTSSTGLKTLTGTLSDKQLESANLRITTTRAEQVAPIVVLDKTAVALAKQDEKKRAEKEKQANEAAAAQAEHQIIVMIDGSKGVNSQLADVTKALDGKPAGRAKRKTVIKTVAPRYLVENVTRVADPAPKHLVVVVDASATVKQYADELSAALAKLPSQIPAELIIASQERDAVKALPLAQGLVELKKCEFVGGQNNLRAVVHAAELAGQDKGGAVLWVHGPQPSLNEEIYIMSQYTAAPSFFELQVGTAETDTFDFFKNHNEIGPFTSVPRDTSSLTKDLTAFFSKWQPDENDYTVTLAQTLKAPEKSVTVSDQEAQELLSLSAARQCALEVSTRHIRKAARLALAYGIVTPVSCALVSNNPAPIDEGSDNINTLTTNSQVSGQTFDQSPDSGNGFAAKLQGATNGTIGPQGMNASYVTGVNTAGTVRVNNLANLEALLNIIANLSEIGCALAGVALIVHGAVAKGTWTAEIMGGEIEFSPAQRVVFGIGLIVVGLALPGMINWFVASARDACLFS